MIVTYLLLFATFNYLDATKVTAPLVRLNDGRDIPCVGLGTAARNSTQEVENAVLWALEVGYRHIDTASYYRTENQIGSALKKKIDGDMKREEIFVTTKELENAILWALEVGYRHIDTASYYRTENQIGSALKKKIDGDMKREEIFVTTKLWNDAHAKEAVVPALRKSLQNLGLDYVDLYLIHWPIGQFANGTYDFTDYVETWRGMVEAKALGLTRSIGVSNFNESQIQRIVEAGLEVPAVLQVEINLNIQQPSLLAFCQSHNIAVVGYTPFGSLFYNRARVDSPPPRVDDPVLVTMAQKYGKTVPQIVLRYLLDLNVIVIPKSLTRARIEDNINVFDFHLTDDDKATLRNFDRNYRMLPQYKWSDHPYYPF